MFLENYALMNPATAATLGIADGDVVKLTNENMRTAADPSATPASIEITAKLTQGIHPEVVAISHHCGHWKYGRFATAGAHDDVVGSRDGDTGVVTDPDVDRIWYGDSTAPGYTDPKKPGGGRGVHPNWIIPNWGDPIAGAQRWNDAVITVTKA